MRAREAEEAEPTSERARRVADVFVSLPLPSTGVGVSYTCTSILRNLGVPLYVDVFTPYGLKTSGDPFRLNETFPLPLRLLPLARGFAYRKAREIVTSRNEAKLVAAVRRKASSSGAPIAYVWSGCSIASLRELRDAGARIVWEMINCSLGTVKAILDTEYRRLGLAPRHGISSEAVEREVEWLQHCDYMLCSNRLSEQSVIDSGVATTRVRPVSFGWEAARFQSGMQALAPIEGVTFLYVGYVCVRKGAHLILRYWAKSGIRGRLVLVGNLEPAIEELCSEYLRRDDVSLLKYKRDIAPYYRSADVFVFPTLEEGGPQVTYEAAGCSLPIVTTPMGAGRVADDSTGFVLDPIDETKWIEAMRALAEDVELRSRMGSSARRRATAFTWEEVGRARGAIFAEIAGIARGAAGAGRSSG
jgi:glycosyltransferase involved in cell wall biosynthesis